MSAKFPRGGGGGGAGPFLARSLYAYKSYWLCDRDFTLKASVAVNDVNA